MLRKQISFLPAFGSSFFGTVTKLMMIALIEFLDSNSNSDDSDTLSLSKSKMNSSLKHSKGTKYKPNFKCKLLGLENKNTMQRFSPKISPSFTNLSPPYPFVTTSQSTEKYSPRLLIIFYEISLPKIIHLVTIPRYHSQIPSLSSPPYIQISISPEDTNFDISLNYSPIHNLWQSTEIYPTTPPPVKFNDIPLTSVNCILNQPDSPVKS